MPFHPQITIAGAGIIGLTLALELHSRGHEVTICDRGTALAAASTAAAGMLAANDPHNPAALASFAQHSLTLYDRFLSRLHVPYQTTTTILHGSATPTTIAERSIDPRQLADALRTAIASAQIELREHTFAPHTAEGILIHATGAWSDTLPAYLRPHIFPRKGQMLRISIPRHRPIHEVHRSGEIYIVPRTSGPQAGTALIGATIEDAGFDTATHPEDLTHLRTLAARLIPAIADERDFPAVEAWAGLRPCTTDTLPILGALGPREFIATGHFRNGILLAPATAILLADLIEDRKPAIDITAFSPARFG